MEQPITFPAQGVDGAGAVTLEGLLQVPAKGASVGVVICHPHPLRGGDMHNGVVAALVAALGAAGIATLRFNFRGVGASMGSHDDGRGERGDVSGAVTALLAGRTLQTVAVAGYSFGSMVGMGAGADDPRVHRLVGVAPPVATRDFSFLDGVAKPKLLIAGDRDDICPLPQLKAIFASIPEPKSLVVMDGADHFFWGLESRAAAAVAEFLAA